MLLCLERRGCNCQSTRRGKEDLIWKKRESEDYPVSQNRRVSLHLGGFGTPKFLHLEHHMRSVSLVNLAVRFTSQMFLLADLGPSELEW